MKSELEVLIDSIKNNTKQISINKVDEINVMKSMLNDKDFKLSIYDKNDGYIGQKCPAEEATMFVKNIIQGATGLDSKDSLHLAESYEFTKKDATFLVSNMKDFLDVYTRTGRKINIIQNEKSESSIFAKNIQGSTKTLPDKNNIGESKIVKTPPFTKIVSVSRSPKYNN